MRRTSLVALAICCALSLRAVKADEVEGLTTFTPGTPAKAAEVNANFQAVKTAVDDNDARIDVLQTGATGLATRVTTLENARDELGPLMYGDGSAGDLIVSGTAVWTGGDAPMNMSFDNVTIESGSILYVASGTTIRCAGTFTNNGTLSVIGSTRGGVIVPSGTATGPALTFPHSGDGSDGPSLPAFTTAATGTLASGWGGGNMPRSYVMSNLSSLRFGGGGGSGAILSDGGAGGGVIKVLCNDAVRNAGTITADGQPGSGGGGGGIVVLASRASVSNTGTLSARGGLGVNSFSTAGAGGGGGGGAIVLIAPQIANTGNANVTGGVGGTAGNAVDGGVGATLRSGGGGGGGSAGAGGNGGTVNGTTSQIGQPGGAGLVLTLQSDPLFLVR